MNTVKGLYEIHANGHSAPMLKCPILLDFQIEQDRWRSLRNLRPRLRKAADAVAALAPEAHRFPMAATLLLTGNAKIKQLNRDFRGIDKPTNVLSFPQYSPQDLKRLPKQKKPTELGDIILAYPYIVAEARKEDKILLDHVTHLAIHGLLHLLGYDHIKEREAARMERLEIEIMKVLGLPDPYAPQPNRD